MADVLRQTGNGDVGTAYDGSLWRSWLGERRMLLVMDDAADEDTVRALLPGLGHNRIIVTSRSRLSGLDAVSRVDVGELSTIDALELLSHLIGAERVAAERPAAEQLVELCGREPLAIRIAGTRLATLRCLSIRRYADRLADDRTLFDELIAGDLSVRSRFDEWFRSVPEDCRRAFGRLGSRPERVLSRESVLNVLAGVATQAEHLLGQLVELNLVSLPDVEVLAHHEVYGITALMRQYARSRLDAAGPGPARTAASPHRWGRAC
jgi:NB-ARC domain